MGVNNFDTDVIIVGCGPTGATLGNLLAVCGINVIILDREDDIYPLPRAVHFDDEVMRVFQTIGISGKLNNIVNVNSGMRFVDNKDNILLDWPRPKEIGIHGWYPSYRFHQPDLEILLRERLNEQKNIAVKFGVEVLSVKSRPNSSTITYVEKRSGKLVGLKSKYIVGCDGAKSIIRAAIGGEVNDHGFQEKWLVVDAILKKDIPELGEFTMQYCDTKRPITYCHQPKNRRRWEIRLLENETEQEFEDTLSIVKEVGFNFSFMFKYSSRPGTKASEYTDQLAEEVKQNRLERLIEIQLQNTLMQNKKLVGETVKVLIEKESKKSKNQWAGRTEGNMWTIFDKGSEKVGDVVDLLITDAQGVTLFGVNANQEYKYEVA